jgi:D-alanyl-D-alanine dipeptidase/CubicO group peptidase (beta-lactamase class C family)
MRLLLAVVLACAVVRAQSGAGHAALRAELERLAARVQLEQGAPSVCIAVVDRVPGSTAGASWSVGCGFEDEARTRAASGATVHRVAGLGGLFVASAAIALAGRGQLDLDRPVVGLLPSFAPVGEGAGAVTVRQLLSHRAGLVREAPVGHAADPTAPGLDALVASLASTRLVDGPGTRIKESRAGIAVAAAAMAAAHGGPLGTALRELVFEPAGLRNSSCEHQPPAVPALGLVWSLDGRRLVAPPGVGGPLDRLQSSVDDLARLAGAWLPGAVAQQAPEGLRALGFTESWLDEPSGVVAGGDGPGTTSLLVALPARGLAVAVVVARTRSAGPARALAMRALQGLLALRAGRPLETSADLRPVGVAGARHVAGRYRCGDDWFDLRERGGELVLDPRNGVPQPLRWRGSRLTGEGCEPQAKEALEPMDETTIRSRGKDWLREPLAAPPDAPADLKPLLGAYGWEHDTLLVLEDAGRLHVVVEWAERAQPVPSGPDLFRLVGGSRDGEELAFQRDTKGAVVALQLGGVRYPRRPEPEVRKFRITPLRPVAAIREEIRTAVPPVQPAGLRTSELVDLRALDPTLSFDVRYATDDNFLGTPVYDTPAAMLQRPAAEALLAAHRSLAPHGLGLCVFDGYRPWRVTKLFWEATPPALREFVADPANGSRHNRGCAVDVGLCDLRTGQLVDMPSDFDEFTDRAHADHPGGTARQRWYRELLRAAMEPHGFSVFESEWWHFDFHLWREYPVLDEPLR